MSTVTIQIGNSDDKLTQAHWSGFVENVDALLKCFFLRVHFFGLSAGNAPWQNAAWVVDIDAATMPRLRESLARLGRDYRQDSIAWTEGETQFLKGQDHA